MPLSRPLTFSLALLSGLVLCLVVLSQQGSPRGGSGSLAAAPALVGGTRSGVVPSFTMAGRRPSSFASSPSILQQRRGSTAARAGFDAPKNFPSGITSSNQERVFLSETQFKTASLDEEAAILENVEKLKLLSGVEESGLLSILEENGVTLSFIESLGLLSTAENLGLLSVVAKPETSTALFGASFGLAIATAASLALFPDDNPVESALKTAVLLGAGGGSVAAAIAARLLNTLQGQGYMKVGTDGGRDELRNLAADGIKKQQKKKSATSILANVERLKLLSQVEKAGLLSKLEKAGFSLSKIEKLGLLSTAEKFKLLSLVSDTETPGKLVGLAAVLAAAAAGLVYAVPDTDSTLIAGQAVGAAALGIPAAAAVGGAGFLSDLQKPSKQQKQ